MGRSVVIVDDHEGFRAQARAMLLSAGYEVVGEAGDGASGIEAALRLTPDVVLLDIQLPDTSGFDVAQELLPETGAPAIVLISSRDASDYGRRIAASGAVAFISKAELSAESLGAALREAGL
jgi:DNA-binding NarL/FixJ family response regulator